MTILGLILFASFFQTSCGDNSSNTTSENSSSTISENNSNTIKMGNLEIAVLDYPARKCTWEGAMKACAELGDGWRLPTKEELFVMYQNQKEIGSKITNNVLVMDDEGYWGSNEGPDDNAFMMQFCGGKLYKQCSPLELQKQRKEKQMQGESEETCTYFYCEKSKRAHARPVRGKTFPKDPTDLALEAYYYSKNYWAAEVNRLKDSIKAGDSIKAAANVGYE